MKKLFLTLASLAVLPASQAAVNPDNILRVGDQLEIIRDISLANPRKYDAAEISVLGPEIQVSKGQGYTAAFRLRCGIFRNVPANTTLNLRQGRMLKVQEIGMNVLLDASVYFNCMITAEGSSWGANIGALETRDLERALPFLKIHRQPPTPPVENDL